MGWSLVVLDLLTALAIARRSVFELRWQVLWFGVGLAIYGASMVWLFPQFEDALGLLTENYPPEIMAFFGGGDLTNAAGFLTLEYQSFAVVIVMVFAVVASTGQLAGDEGRGTLEILLAQPVGRARMMVEKAVGVLVATLLICVLISVGWLVSVPFIDFDGELTLAMVLGATFGVMPVVAFVVAMGFLLGALAPSRGSAAGILSAVVVLSYIGASLAQVIDAISWLRWVSPYYYSDAARWLTEGPVWWHQVGLVVVAALVFWLALVAFARREIGSGRWQSLR